MVFEKANLGIVFYFLLQFFRGAVEANNPIYRLALGRKIFLNPVDIGSGYLHFLCLAIDQCCATFPGNLL